MEIEEVMRRFFQDSGIKKMTEKYVEFIKKYGDNIELKHEYSPGDVCKLKTDEDKSEFIITKIRYVSDGNGGFYFGCDGIRGDGSTITGQNVDEVKYLGWQSDFDAAMRVLFGNFTKEE